MCLCDIIWAITREILIFCMKITKAQTSLCKATVVSVSEHSDFSGGSRVVHSNPTSRQNYFIFMENFQKNQEKIKFIYTGKIPFVNLNPLSRNPGSINWFEPQKKIFL